MTHRCCRIFTLALAVALCAGTLEVASARLRDAHADTSSGPSASTGSVAGTITTVAGNGVYGFAGDGGPATSAELSRPNGVAVDGAGSLYIADTYDDRVRKVDPSGTITTVAGDGVAGFSGDGGPATSAELSGPAGVVVDGAGDLYIADNGNNRIRRVDSSGTITTVAGNGVRGYSGDGGPATTAELFWPDAVAVDGAGDLYVADNGNQRVRRVDPSGTITTVAGDGDYGFAGDGGPAASAELYGPQGVVVDGAGDLYIADNGNNRIRKVDAAGTITTVAGNGVSGYSGDGGLAISAELFSPDAVSVDSIGDLSIADESNNRIRKVDPAGTITTVAGNGVRGFAGDGGPATSAELWYPTGVTVDGAGDLYIADSHSNRIREVLSRQPMGGAAFGLVSPPVATAYEDGTSEDNYAPSVSYDGRYVAYTSADDDFRVYLRDTENDQTSLVSGGGSQGVYDYSLYPVVSADGRYVTFGSSDNNGLVNDGAGEGIFRRDMSTGVAIRVSVDNNGVALEAPGDDSDGPPAMSADGRYVVFSVDNPSGSSCQTALWLRDLDADTSVQVAPCGSHEAISADGSTVAYEAADSAGNWHVYGWDVVGGTSLGMLSGSAVFNVGGLNSLNYRAMGAVSLSADGRYVAFALFTNLSNGNGIPDETIEVLDRTAGTMSVVPQPLTKWDQGGPYQTIPVGGWDPQISADGRRVAYLHSNRDYYTGDAYVADMRTRTYTQMSVGEDFTATSPDGSDAVAISGDGRYVAFDDTPWLTSPDSPGGEDVYMRDRTQSPVNVSAAELRGSDLFCPVCQSSVRRLDPINTATGAYERQDNDISLAGPGVNFSLERDYSSDDTGIGLFGLGWSANLTSSLESLTSGDVEVTAGTGAVVDFVKQLDGSYAPPPEVRADLTSSPSGGWQLVSANQLSTTFDAAGRMTAQADRNDTGLAYSYDTQNRVSTITDAAGHVGTLTYGSAGAATGLISDVTLADGRVWHYTYAFSAADGTTPLLSTMADPAGHTTAYSYDSATNQLTSILDGNGHTIASIGYGGTGVVSQLTEAASGGAHGSYSWSGDADGTGTATTTDANGGVSTDVYLGNNLMSETDPLGHTTSYTYDDHNNRTTVTDAEGSVTTDSYDAAGNVLRETDPLGNVTTYSYDSSNNVLSETDPLGHVTTYSYDTSGNRLSETDPAGGVWGWTYDSAGNQLTSTDPDGHTTTYTYDAAGNQLTSTDPLGHTTTYTYDAAGNQLTSTDPLGHTTTYIYDSNGRMLTQTDPLGRETTYGYDAVGNKTSITTAAGTAQAATTNYTYDAANHLLTTTDPLGRVTTNAYDNVGNLISTTDPAGDVTSYGYDAANHKVSTTKPNGNVVGADPASHTTTYGYDSVGNQVSVSQPLGNGRQVMTRTDYNAAGQVVDTVDANGNQTDNVDDAAGNLTQVTDPTGAITSYGYDALNRKTSQTDPLRRTTTYRYDGEGDQTAITDPAGDETTDSYDGAGRKVAEVSPNGNAAGATPADFTTTYAYDAAGDLTSTTDPLGHTSSASYDAAGERISSTDATGAVTGYAYDAAGNLTTTTQPNGSTISDGFDLAGQKTTTTDAAGHTTSYGYDGAGRMTSSTDPSGAHTSYSYDADGNQLTSTSPNGGVSSNTYDAADRLLGSTSPTGGTTTYSYDGDGNKNAVIDPDGNTTSYSYDKEGRVLATVQPDGTEVDNAYDAAGQLISYTTPYNPAPGSTPAQTVPAPAAPPTPPAADTGGSGGTASPTPTPTPSPTASPSPAPSSPTPTPTPTQTPTASPSAGLGNPYPAAVLADAPSVYYRLGDAPGAATAVDSSGNSNDGAVTNTVTFGGSGALLNDADTAAGFGAGEVQETSGAGLPTGNGDRSIEVWFNTTSTDHQVLAWWGTDAPNQEMELGLNGGNEIYWTGEYSEADFTAPTSFADGAWHHLVLTYTGSTLTASAYLDGGPIGSDVLSGAWDTTLDATGLTVGGPQYQGYFFHGGLDEFAIYPTVLSASQVAAHYTASGRPAPGAPGVVGAIAVNAGDNAVAAAWNPPGDGIAVDYYRVSAIDPTGQVAASTIIPATTTTAVLTGLPAGDGWTVRVVAVNGLGAGSASTSDGFTITGATGSYAAQVRADAPAVYYRLDDAAGAPAVADSSGNDRDGTVNNTVTFGRPGGLATDTNTAATFGTGEIEMASGAGLPVGNADRSIEAWFKTTDTDQQVLTWWGTSAPGQQMELGINGGTQIYWTGQYNEADFTSAASFADNTWHHLVVTYDGSSRTAVGYLDGTMLGSHVLGSDWHTTLDATGLMVGGPEYQGYFFHGDLDDVAIYPTVLSPARVLAHYSASRLAGLATTTYTYDPDGRKASMSDPDGHVTTYGYDADGNQTSLIDPMGRVTSQTFDADNRLTAITYSDGTTPNVTYTYDAAGRRTAMVDGTGTTSYTYNTAKQLTAVTDGAGDTIGYGYDALGRISSITYPDGHQVTRGYDSNSRLASVTDWNNHATTFGYDGDGNLVSTTFGNGVVEATTVDTADQTTGITITNAAGTGLATFGYTYTPGGQLATANDSLAPTTDNTYNYTPNRQLAGQNGDSNAYGYDGTGNITGLDTGAALTYDPTGRLTVTQPASGAVTSYGYDANGNRISATTGNATTSYVYDQANRLTIYTGPGASAGMGIGYDGDGLRTSSGGDFVGSRDYTWDSVTSGLPLLLSDGVNDYIYGPGGQIIEQVDQTDATTTYLHSDGIGSVRLLTDNTGAAVGTRSYDPYGSLLAHDGEQTTPFGYTGQYTDPSGLIYLRARYYDPFNVNFLSVDPAVNETRAAYGYVDGDPLGATDRTGLRMCPAGSTSPECDGYSPAPTSDPAPSPAQSSPTPSPGPPVVAPPCDQLASATPAQPRIKLFDVPRLPGHGDVRIGFFIRQKEACFAGQCGGGDGRGFDVNTSPDENRAFIYADYDTGVGLFYENYSCHKFHADCVSANEITASTFSSHIGRDQSLSFHISAKNSLHPHISPAISAELELLPERGTNRMCLLGSVDQFPSFEAYQDFDDGSTATLYRHSQTSLGLPGLFPVVPKTDVGCVVGDPGDLGPGSGAPTTVV